MSALSPQCRRGGPSSSLFWIPLPLDVELKTLSVELASSVFVCSSQMHDVFLFGCWYANGNGHVLLKKRSLERSFQYVRIYF